jgi:hypothetical protein
LTDIDGRDKTGDRPVEVAMAHVCRCPGWAVIVLGLVPATVSSAEVRLETVYLASLVEKLPACPFEKGGRYKGAVDEFRLLGIDSRSRRFLVTCRVIGEFYQRPVVAGLVRGDGAPAPADPSDRRWKSFHFDVRAAVNIEAGLDGAPRFDVDVAEVKRRELEGLAGLLAKGLGREFDAIVTRVADGKANALSDRLNAQLVRRMAAFREYGVFCGIDYAEAGVVLRFDLTRLRREGIAGYVYPTAQLGTVPLTRWRNTRRGDHFYTVHPTEPDPRAYAYEGIAGHVLMQPAAGTVALHRLYGPKEHFYTTNPEGENVYRLGLRPEGVACYLFPNQVVGTVPLYRFVDPRNGLHLYTTHPHAEFAK